MVSRVRLSLGTLVVAVTLAAPAQAATIFFQNFEAGLGGNESNAGIFVINNTGFGNNGTNMMGHRGTYTDDEYSYYQVIGIDLTAATSAEMTFDYRGQFENHFDRFNVIATTGAFAPPAGLLTPHATSNMQFIDLDHAHRPELGQFAYDTSGASGGQGGVARFDLSAFLGTVVNLRFQFGSDSSVVAGGFNMDNLRIEGDIVPEPASMLLVGFGTAALAARRARRRAK